MLLLGNCIEVLKTLPDNSVDSVVTDPPYELGFMGKSWDNKGIAYSMDMWLEVLRVLKPGGHLLSFGGTRTYHRMACAIEDAGFEIRDQMQWLYGSGFPKSYNISKGIDKMAGAEREVVGYHNAQGTNKIGAGGYSNGIAKLTNNQEEIGGWDLTSPSTPSAIQWDGWGSALKPANEPICVARKPLSEKSIVENVLKWGTGGINIDGCRVQTSDNLNGGAYSNGDKNLNDATSYATGVNAGIYKQPIGRFPANLILDEEAGAMLDEMSGNSVSKRQLMNPDPTKDERGTFQLHPRKYAQYRGHSDSGGASRFFYCAKASRSERNAGLEGMAAGDRPIGISNWDGQTNGSGEVMGKSNPQQNHHPTVKPISLMRYLCRLVTPPKGTVLDPFMGSWTTGCAASLEGFEFIGIEREPEYMEIAERRIAHYQKQPSLL